MHKPCFIKYQEHYQPLNHLSPKAQISLRQGAEEQHQQRWQKRQGAERKQRRWLKPRCSGGAEEQRRTAIRGRTNKSRGRSKAVTAPAAR
ncbi:hypothetical protein PIB30_073449 [Stylosanthes scabra]|uniref:Uncharacterized protein n=1 Tax=Stylosanthes scabra TaxID=79078 RepID=A0ABU6YND1_9FABA|nr:hypothetical protein [Stylosanthes scabra]